MLTIFIYLKKQRLYSNFREACIELKKNLKSFLVPFLATREVLELLTNEFIRSGTSIKLLRHLEHQNPSIISEDRGKINIGCKICNQWNMEHLQYYIGYLSNILYHILYVSNILYHLNI